MRTSSRSFASRLAESLGTATIVPIVGFAVLLAMAAARPARAEGVTGARSEQVWARDVGEGRTQYLTLHSEGGRWLVELTAEARGALPELQWSKEFAREAEATRYAARAVEKGTFSTLPPESPRLSALAEPMTEARGIALWKATQEWDWGWERKYADWIAAEVSPRFFAENGIKTDCADVAYALRWIFARMNGLPAANRLIGSGALFTQDSVKGDWVSLPAHPDWRKDKRFLAALEYVMAMTYTHTLMRDSYPVEISTESMLRGTHHLELHDSTGHTMIVYRTDYSDAAISPIEVMYSNMPRMVRELMQGGYWGHAQPEAGEAGFLRLRWPRRAGTAGWDLAAPEAHPHYSKEQYAPEFMAGRSSFAEAVLLRLNPKLDFRSRLREGAAYLNELFRARVETVAKGFAFCSRSPRACPEGSQAYDDWSTPSRDARAAELIAQIEALVRALGPNIPELHGIWAGLRKQPSVAIEGASYSLGELAFAWRARAFASDPRLPVATRWGLAPRPFAEAMGRRVSATLAERAKRIAAQGERCASAGDCAPGTVGWTSFNSFELDREIRAAGDAIEAYCDEAPTQRCEETRAAARATRVAGTAARGLTVAQWAGLAPWLVSDPRAGVETRWGGNRDRRRSAAIELKHPLVVSATGMAFAKAGKRGSNGNTEGHPGLSLELASAASVGTLFDLPQGVRIPAPEGTSWVAFDERNDWVVAASSREIRVTHPRRGEIAAFPTASATPAPRWARPGVLVYAESETAAGLVDFNRSPRFEAHGLPLPGSEQPGGDGAWIAPKNEGYELIAYQEGRLIRRGLKLGALGTGVLRPIGVESRIPGFVIAHYARCMNPSCSTTAYQGTFGADLSTGEARRLSVSGEEFSFSADGRFASRHVYGDAPFVELIQYDERLRPRSRLKVGASLRDHRHFGETDYVHVTDGARQRFFRYRNGSLRELALLPDETHPLSSLGDFIVVQLGTGGQRVRRFDGPAGAPGAFDTAPGDTIAPIGTRLSGQALPAVLISFAGRFDQQAIYELARPEAPLLTGAIKKPDSPSSPFARLPPITELVRERGILLPLEGERQLWIDDLD